jgi:hypothetical protein
LEYDDEIFCAELLYNWLKNIWINLPTTNILIREIISPNSIVEYIIDEWINKKEFTFILFLDNMQKNTKYYNYNVLVNQMKKN